MLKDKLNGAETLVSEYLDRLQAWKTNKTKEVNLLILSRRVSQLINGRALISERRKNHP